MKVKLLVIVAALLVSAAMAFAQPSAVTWWIGVNEAYEDHHIVANCGQDGDTPVPPGRAIRCYWDANGNGPDEADQLWPLQGPYAANYNEQFMNDALYPGTFTQMEAVWNVESQPPAPGNRYYLKVFCEDGADDEFVTQPMVLAVGPQDHFFYGDRISCDPASCGQPPSCTPDPVVTLVGNGNYPSPQNYSACARLLAGTVTVINVTPAFNASNIPTISWTAGCEDDPTCRPLDVNSIIYDPNGWQFVPGNPGYMTNTITTTSTEGCCVTLNLEFILPVGMTSFTAVPRSDAVELAWVVSSETDIDRYSLVRDGREIASVRASGPQTYTFVDNTAKNGTTYNYTVIAIDAQGNRAAERTVEGVTPSLRNAVVTEYALHQNYPNPFNPSTSIRFDLVESNYVTLKIYNAAGQEVATLVNGQMPVGVNLVNFDAANLTSGLYFYTIKAGNAYSATKKMLLVK